MDELIHCINVPVKKIHVGIFMDAYLSKYKLSQVVDSLGSSFLQKEVVSQSVYSKYTRHHYIQGKNLSLTEFQWSKDQFVVNCAKCSSEIIKPQLGFVQLLLLFTLH